MMFKCEECGHIFECGEESVWIEPHGEERDGCPICKGTYIEVAPCKICGRATEEDYCDACKEEVRERFKRLVDENFDDEERVLLNELYDGEEI